MESPNLPNKPFLFVGNHTCLDFINTRIIQDGQPLDLLSTFSDLVEWLRQAHLLDTEAAKHADLKWSGRSEGIRTLDQARTFRATLRDMVERMAAGKSVPQTAIDAINTLLRHRSGYAQVTQRGGTCERHFHVASKGLDVLLGLLAESAGELLCTCDVSLIKKCQNPACVLYFYDTTKNHGRHWCSMSVCGNRIKVAAHYRRQRMAMP
jgi:predicted RNA-binding Zn ribbon-like protein